ncbi:TspO/MBR family protein [Stakelama marina]|uniref:Tryptophan-rich sensory protein n=1 Tax=Stakelama marina TaxID=2826939 RepID=A0A8T4IGZ2_9SPHN|nr:TspO/MBR family protein [Stakelama marina]MBR0553830.1 tryptophan-rich sensory protein [Stakelama marina]
MQEIASQGQLRMAFLRWAMVTVPFVLLIGFLSANLVPAGSQNAWYAALSKPAGTPPDWAFPVAWTTIYILLGLAVAMVLNARGSRLRAQALALFAVQLAANFAWTPLFFGMHRITWSLVLIAAIFLLVLAMTFVFARIRKAAAWCLVPYLIWVSYAGIILFQIGQLNPNAEHVVTSPSATQITL